MRIHIDVEESGVIVRSAEDDVSPDETIESIATRLASKLEVTSEELAEGLGTDGVTFEKTMRARDCLRHGERWRHRRVCVDMHFETEHFVHHFSPGGHWSEVHRFGCRRFEIPKDACANLELHDGAPDGPALNEKLKIGRFEGCKVVWLVKPGPEPNG
jgi:hypothetical protein